MSEEIRKKIHDISLVVKEIKEFPQTYNTILKEACKDGTCQYLLRKKLNKLCKAGVVCKTSIPGTRFGKAIFYFIPKKYFILVEADRIGSNVYCFFEYKKFSRYHIKVNIHWELIHGFWKKKKEKIIFSGNILKWI